MFFKNRIDAGQQLAEKLAHYKNNPGVVVLGLPRGGVPVAYIVAKALNAPLDIICPRKIGAPMNPEFAIGAITETGDGIFNESIINELGISWETIRQLVEEQKAIAKKRLQIYRHGKPKREIEGKIVILIDDGLATGSTMMAAINSVKTEGAEKIVVAIPVSPQETLIQIESMADEVICLSSPSNFMAVGQFYLDFAQTEDEEVIRYMKDTYN